MIDDDMNKKIRADRREKVLLWGGGQAVNFASINRLDSFSLGTCSTY